MGVIYLVRHAQASFGAADYDRLSDLGVRQARHLGEVLTARGIAPSLVITGSQVRQKETARLALLAAGVHPEVDVDQGYDEFDHEALLDVPELRVSLEAVRAAGSDEQRRSLFQSALNAATELWVNATDSAYPESFAEFRARVLAAVRRTADRTASGQTAIVVTSGGPIALAAAALSEAAGPGWLRLNRVMVNVGISKVVSGRSGLSLVSLNEQGHVEGLNAALFSYR